MEHRMTAKVGDCSSARFQACCLNYNYYIRNRFGGKLDVDKHLSFSLRFSSIQEERVNQFKEFADPLKGMAAYIHDSDETLPGGENDDLGKSCLVLFALEPANRKGQAGKVVGFIPASSPGSKKHNVEYVLSRKRKNLSAFQEKLFK